MSCGKVGNDTGVAFGPKSTSGLEVGERREVSLAAGGEDIAAWARLSRAVESSFLVLGARSNSSGSLLYPLGSASLYAYEG